MRHFFSLFLRPWVYSLIGVLLLSVIVWFEGPLLVFGGKQPLLSEVVRGYVIAALFFIWVLFILGRFLVERFHNASLVSAAFGRPPERKDGAASEVEASAGAELTALAGGFENAIRQLRTVRSQGGRGDSLYRLPWYMFLGAPGAGKTTMLLHSGLRFPLAETMNNKPVPGVGGTRNCEWWFTDEAVLLDTAGRYTTQDSFPEADKAAWDGFLRLLKKHRRRRPINGVMVAISIADLLQTTDRQRHAQALAIRERIRDLHTGLGIGFPVYVILTKCDLLAGFTEFFDTFGAEARAQVFGVTFPATEMAEVDASLANFPGEFDALERQLLVRLSDHLQSERDLQRRALIHGFPQQFASIRDLLQGMLNDIFQSTRYEQPALLRGVYFTSGTQEGSPIDRVLASLAGTFGFHPQESNARSATGRSYFLRRLLQEVIFPESGLAGASPHFERRRKIFGWAAIGSVGISALLAAGGLTSSYWQNKSLVAKAASMTDDLERVTLATPLPGSIQAELSMLDAARSLPAGYDDRGKAVPVSMTFGLYQGEKLGVGARSAYCRLLGDTLLPRLQLRMEDELRRTGANGTEYLFESLRAYLMLGERRHFDPKAVRRWADLYWLPSLGEAGTPQRRSLQAHVEALLDACMGGEHLFPVALDRGLVDRARDALARASLPQWLYDRIKNELANANPADFNLAANAGSQSLQVLRRRSGEPLTRGVPGLYTRKGYVLFADALSKILDDFGRNAWVFFSSETLDGASWVSQLRAVVEERYFTDYIKHWDALLADVGVVPFVSLDQGARLSSILAGPESPLRHLLQAIARETSLQDALPSQSNGSPANAANPAGIGASTAAGGDAALEKQALNPVDAHFRALHALVGGGGGTGESKAFDGFLGAMALVGQFFDDAERARRTGASPPSPDGVLKALREAGTRAGVSDVLKDVEANVAGLTQTTEKARLNLLWRSSVLPFCQQAIAGRYPFVRTAQADVTSGDFGRFFSPGGMADVFFKNNLALYVSVEGGRWRWRTVEGSPPMSREVLAQFERIDRIRNDFFVPGGGLPAAAFELQLLSVADAIKKMTLDIDGQKFSYVRGETTMPGQFVLPGGKGVPGSRLEIVHDKGVRNIETKGEWGWFRMIDQGELITTPQRESYKLRFNFPEGQVVFALKAGSVMNPFQRAGLQGFRCLENL